ncbi:uncharacterized protein LOC107849123 isoform X2 [Capsicum annuum]|uniref:uncharacterized protein LOC107849123 isoform X2 n=1 Tax=Capsicum annuum TaxID=4072 RepID=UPI001FB15D0B|nr:uncharacterized protein LOC107849123 isoform X2 [Capsicum annuum]
MKSNILVFHHVLFIESSQTSLFSITYCPLNLYGLVVDCPSSSTTKKINCGSLFVRNKDGFSSRQVLSCLSQSKCSCFPKLYAIKSATEDIPSDAASGPISPMDARRSHDDNDPNDIL